MSTNKEYRLKNFKGAKIEDTMQYILELYNQQKNLLDDYKSKEDSREYIEFHRGMTTMAITILSYMKQEFGYDRLMVHNEDELRGMK